MEHRVALAHASGIAAEAILEKLPESGLTPDSLVFLDHETRAGNRLAYADRYLNLQDQAGFDFSECALLLLPEADADLERAALAQGCVVASHTLGGDAPVLFAGEQSQTPRISFDQNRLRLAGPELCCLVPALLALQRLAAFEQINCVWLRSAEFHGKGGVEELASQTINLLNAREARAAVYPEQIAFNLLSEAGDVRFGDDLRRILVNNSCSITQQSVNVPIFHGFAAAVQLRFASKVSPKACESLLSSLDKMQVRHAAASPISDCNQSFSCVISHLEQAPNQPSSLSFWMIADPMRYGLANNYVNVTDFLLKSFL